MDICLVGTNLFWIPKVPLENYLVVQQQLKLAFSISKNGYATPLDPKLFGAISSCCVKIMCQVLVKAKIIWRLN